MSNINHGIERAPIYLLMEENNALCAYTNKALADADCWTCNDAQRYLDMEQFNYWVKTIDLVLTEGALVDGITI